jgi:hypothetical protein
MKKPKPAKTYTYFIHETQSGKNEGDMVVKRYGNLNTDDEIIESKKSPKEIHQQQQLYNKGLIGISDRTGLDYYAQTIEYGRQGGKAKRIWTNEAEKQRAKRAKKKWLVGKELNDKEKALLIKAGLIKPEEKTAIKNQRTAAYKYHANRAASSKERKARWKAKQVQIKARQ